MNRIGLLLATVLVVVMLAASLFVVDQRQVAVVYAWAKSGRSSPSLTEGQAAATISRTSCS